MSNYAFLIGRNDASPVFSADPSDEEIAYACDWIPIERRKERLKRVFPAYLSPLFDALEQTVKAAKSPYIQIVLSDLDIYLSYEEMGDLLRDNVAAMDSDTVAAWDGLMSFVQASMNGGFGHVVFNGGTDFQAAVGYLPDEFAISVNPSLGAAGDVEPPSHE